MFVLPEAQLYINGKLRRAENDKQYDVINPWTAEVIGKAADASRSDVENAIAAARNAFDNTEWSSEPDFRFELLKRLHNRLSENRDRLVDLARYEIGSAMGAVAEIHVDSPLERFQNLLELFGAISWSEGFGDSGPAEYRSRRMVVYEPVGVVGAITPWNAPIVVNIGKAISALLAGCTVILKAAPDTPGSAAIFGEMAQQAGLPDGVFNVITSADPVMAGGILIDDARVDSISFTGSTAVGRQVMERGAKSLKRVFLELGGKSAKIILEDTPNFAQEVAAAPVISHAGQGCAVMTRLLVPKSRYEEAKEALIDAYAKLENAWGDFDEPGQAMGPLISRNQLYRVMNYIELGKYEGATLLAGGNLRPDKGSGFFVEPTCFVDVSNDMRIAREEIFGPVLVVIPFEDEEDAIRIANDSEYGLSGGVSTADFDRAMHVASRVRSGSMMINGGLPMAGDLPFGGVKASGIGREWGRAGIEEFLESKVIAWRLFADA